MGKIAIIGSRGIPARYGGFETFTDDLSTALVKKGHKIFVSCEYCAKTKRIHKYHGVNLFYFALKSPKLGFLRVLYEFIYDSYSLFWASQKADVIYMLGYSASFVFFIPYLFGKTLLVNTDGLEWKRSKFSSAIKLLLKFSERMMILWAHGIVADSNAIKSYMDDKYKINSYCIPYGVLEPESIEWNSNILDPKLKNIECGEYLLVVSRLEPENNIKMIVEGFLRSKTDRYLVIVGEFTSDAYKAEIEDLLSNDTQNKIIFTGAIYNSQLLNMLRQNCFAYFHGHSVGGTNPSLLEAMVMKNIIISHDNVFNREVCGDSGFYFADHDDLKDKIEFIENNYSLYAKMKQKLYYRAKRKYSIRNMINSYTNLFEEKLKATNEKHTNLSDHRKISVQREGK